MMRPWAIVDYEREPWVMDEGTVRITFDMNVRAAVGSFDIFDATLPALPVLEPGKLVMEVKFTEFCPQPVRDMVPPSVGLVRSTLPRLVCRCSWRLIYCVYKRFFIGVVYSRSFAVTLVGMCVLTCMVTLAISTNVVISLGMVGALSIVRYRTAVKDPLDLLYLFWAITTGITAGAGMYALVGLTAVVIVVMIAGFASHQDKARVYMMVIHYTGQTTGDDIVRAFGCTKFTVKSKTMRGDKVEMAVEVFSDGVDMPYTDAIRALDGVEDLTLIQYNGEYHG